MCYRLDCYGLGSGSRHHKPRRATWAKCGREPAPRWAGVPLTPSPCAPEREGGETLGVGGPKAHLGVRHPLSLPWPPHLPSRGAAAPPSVGTLGVAHPLPSSYI
ncbi:hypothetical protein D1007_01264 [Hordeum vulgare]|nr:hypothetical protein D1007_01264 [Hordeum vulgare]